MTHTRSARTRCHLLILATTATALSVPLASRATTATWLSPTSGDWFTPANWSPAVVPSTPGDAALVSATGLGSYTLSVDGSSPLSLGTLTLDSPDATVALAPTSDYAAQILSAVLYRGTLALAPASPAATASLVSTLTNFSTLLFAPGAGGSRTYGGSLTNSGLVAVNAPTTFALGSVVNNNAGGTFAVAQSQSATLRTASRFIQNAGSTLSLDGPLTLQEGTFTFAGGAITGPGAVTLTSSAFPFGPGGTLALGTAGTGGNFILRGLGNFTISQSTAGGYILPSTSITVDASEGPSIPPNDFNNLPLVLPAGTFTNAGTFTVRSSYADHPVNVQGLTSVLNNTGTLNILPGLTPAAPRTFTMSVRNLGTMSVGSNTTFYNAGTTNAGSLTIAPGATLSQSLSGSFTQAAGTLAIQGAMVFTNSQTFNYVGGYVAGTVTMNGGTVILPAAPVATAANFLFRNSGSLSQSTSTSFITPGMSVVAESNPTFQPLGQKLVLTLPSTSSFTNSGTLTLRSAGADRDVDITGFGLINGGSLLVQPGPGGGGNRGLLLSSLVNTGSISVGADTSFSGSVTNSGLITVAPGKSLVPANAGFGSFTQSAGTLDIQGAFVSGSTFNYTGGAILGTVTMQGGTVYVPPPAAVPPASAPTFDFRRDGSLSQTTTGAAISPAMTVIADANPSMIPAPDATSTLTLSFPSVFSFTSAGTLILRSTGGDYSVTVNNFGNTLVNTGSILVQPGPNPLTAVRNRTLNVGTLANPGFMSVGANTTVSGTLVNSGTLAIAPGSTLSMRSSSFVQSGGTLDIQGGLNTSGSFVYTGGAINGTVAMEGGTLSLPSPGIPAPGGTFLFRRSGSLSQATSTSQIVPGMSVVAESNASFTDVSLSFSPSFGSTLTNAGSLTLRSVDADYPVAVGNTAVTLLNTGSLLVQPGPLGGGSRTLSASTLVNTGTFSVGANTTLSGSLNNGGLLTVASGKTLSVSSTLTQSAGTLDVQGSLSLQFGTFAYNGGSVLGTLTFSSVTGLALPSSSVFSPSPGTYLFRANGSLSQPSPGSIIPRMSVIAEANPAFPSLTLSNSFSPLTNAGNLTLRSSGGDYSVSLNAFSSTLTNTGTLSVLPGPNGGGSRTISTNTLKNSGTLYIGTNTTLVGVLSNTGDVSIAPGKTLTLLGLLGFPGFGSLSLPDTSTRVILLGGSLDFTRIQLSHGDYNAVFPNPDDLLTLGYGKLPASSNLVVRPALKGDANLDDVLNADDFALLDHGLAFGGTFWSQGDFNYDGTVDSLDYLMLDSTYAKQQGGSVSPALLARRESQFGPAYVSQLLVAIPEPTSLLIGNVSVWGGLTLFKRTRRASRRS